MLRGDARIRPADAARRSSNGFQTGGVGSIPSIRSNSIRSEFLRHPALTGAGGGLSPQPPMFAAPPVFRRSLHAGAAKCPVEPRQKSRPALGAPFQAGVEITRPQALHYFAFQVIVREFQVIIRISFDKH